MNLQTHVPPRLWESVRDSYEAGNYSHAILEATHLLSNVLRERAGVDGDGASLVGQALGGDQPKLRINNLHTESEKNVQKGIEQILRGIYMGIRNPRSHDQVTDEKETADAVIHFIGYLLGILSTSKDAFTVESFLDRVRDPEFVTSRKYAELLVSEIPSLRVGEALMAIFKQRRKLNIGNRRHLIRTLLESLSPNQLTVYLSAVSNELRVATDEATIRTALQMVTAETWSKLDELPRLRIENKLISGIKTAECDPVGLSTAPLSTWASSLMKSFGERNQGVRVILSRLESGDQRARTYVLRFFFAHFGDIITDAKHVERAVKSIAAAVKEGDEFARQTLVSSISNLNDSWQTQFAEALKEETDPDNPAVYLSNGDPFLSSPENDDIPF